MSEQEFESYLRLLSRFLHLSGGQRETISRELRAHMEDRLDELIARGYTREEAIETALDEFGDAAALAGEFGRIGRRRRWIMRTTGGIVGIAAAVLFVSFLLPENRRHVPAPPYSVADESSRTSDSLVRASSRPAEVIAAIDPRVSMIEAKTREKLSQTLTEVKFDNLALEEVLGFIAEKAGVTIDVNWGALQLVGIEKSSVTTTNMRDVSAGTALSLALKHISGDNVTLAYAVTEGFVRVSTQEDLNKETFSRVYDCKDLVGGELAETQIKEIRRIIGQTDAARSELLEKTLKSYVEPELVSLITSHVQPGSWAPSGTTGTVSTYDGLLVVTSNASAHQQIVELLEMMRKAKISRGSSMSTTGVTEIKADTIGVKNGVLTSR